MLITGGLPPLDDGCTAEAVYRACYKRVALQNAKFYERFPEDEGIVRAVVLHLAEAEGGGVSSQPPIQLALPLPHKAKVVSFYFLYQFICGCFTIFCFHFFKVSS